MNTNERQAAIQALLSTKMRAALPISGCSIATRPMGELATTIGDAFDILAGYKHLAGLTGSPIPLAARNASTYSTAGGWSASDITAIMALELTVAQAGAIASPALWGWKIDVRTGNNFPMAPFTLEVSNVIRNLNNPTAATALTKDAASAGTHIISPTVGPNSSFEFFLFATRQAQVLTYGTNEFNVAAGQGSYAFSPWHIRPNFTPLPTYAANATVSIATLVTDSAAFDACAVSFKNTAVTNIAASATPMFATADSVDLFAKMVGISEL